MARGILSFLFISSQNPVIRYGMWLVAFLFFIRKIEERMFWERSTGHHYEKIVYQC